MGTKRGWLKENRWSKTSQQEKQWKKKYRSKKKDREKWKLTHQKIEKELKVKQRKISKNLKGQTKRGPSPKKTRGVGVKGTQLVFSEDEKGKKPKKKKGGM